MFVEERPPVEHQVLGTPEHVLAEWLAVDVPDLETAAGVIEQIEACAARDVQAEWVNGKIRVRWR
jgi:hypothetical protein